MNNGKKPPERGGNNSRQPRDQARVQGQGSEKKPDPQTRSLAGTGRPASGSNVPVPRTSVPAHRTNPPRRRPVQKPEITLRKPRTMKHFRRGINPGAVLSILIFVLIITISIMFIIQSRNDDKNAAQNTDTADTISSDSNQLEGTTPSGEPISAGDEGFIGPIQPDSEKPAPSVDCVTRNASDVFAGDLILVNSMYPYVFPESPASGLTVLYGNKSKSYKISDSSISLRSDVFTIFNQMMDDFNAAKNFHEVIVVSGYRDFEYQQSVFNARVASQGEEQAKMFVALPGYSEHHTGLAMDISVYTDAGVGKALGDVEECKWVIENAYKYGFILRYPSDKIAITGIGYEPWHYRYVGTPFAYIMESQNLCLEEFTELMYNYTWEGKRYLTTDNNGIEWQLYFVKANPTGETNIPIPVNSTPQISGNNIDGFIVAVSGAQ